MGYIVAFLLGGCIGTILTTFMIAAHSDETLEAYKTKNKD